MTPTRKRNLLLLACMCLLVGATVERVYLATTGRIVPISLWTPSAVAMIDASLFLWALNVRRRLMHLARARHDKRSPGKPFVMQEPPLDPMTAARTVALAFAASRAGSMLSGLYAGMALLLFQHWASENVQWRIGLSTVTTLLSVGLVVIALWLERMCKLPDPPANAQTSVA